MRKSKSLYLVLTLMLVSLTAFAQTAAPEIEVYGGYQYNRLDTGAVQGAINLIALEAGIPPSGFGRYQNLNGCISAVSKTSTVGLAVVVDVSGTYYTNRNVSMKNGDSTTTLRVRLHSYTFMAGPQLTMRRSSAFQPFVRGLIGGGFLNYSANILVNNVPTIPEVKCDDANFAFGGGAGTDINFSPRLGVRLAVDYIRTQVYNDNQNNLRGTVSLVFHWGSTYGPWW